MREDLSKLLEIQKIDIKIRDVEKRRADVPKALAALEGSASSLHGEVARLQEELDGLVRETKTLQGSIQAEALKIRKWETRLNEIRNQREYAALSREIEGSKRSNREAEDRLLELASSKESSEKRLEGLMDQLGEQEVDAESERKRVAQQLSGIDEEMSAEEERRAALCPTLPKNLLKKYESIRAKRFGVGLVSVIGGACQGCNMRLPPQLYNILQRGDSIEQCPSCLRIIYWEPLLAGSSDEDEGATSAASAAAAGKGGKGSSGAEVAP